MRRTQFMVLGVAIALLMATAHASLADGHVFGGDKRGDGVNLETSPTGEVLVRALQSGGDEVVSAGVDGFELTSRTTIRTVRVLSAKIAGTDTGWQDQCYEVTYVTVPLGEEPVEADRFDAQLDSWEARMRAAIDERNETAIREHMDATGLSYDEAAAAIELREYVDLPWCGDASEEPVELDFGSVWDRIDEAVDRLPAPTLVLQPGEVVTGLEAYLETGRPLSYATGHELFDGLDGPVSVGAPAEVALSATGAMVVDWGDGSEPVEAEVPGGPYPGDDPVLGAVTHTWASIPDAGTTTIRVVDAWTVRATVTFDDGTTVTLTADEELLPAEATVPVTEVAAVRDR